LVQHIRSHTHRPDDPRTTALAVADVLDSLKPTAEMLTAEERAGQADEYARYTLHTETTFSISAVVWRPGQLTEIHDHLVWCSYIVLQGVETETIFDIDRDRLVEVGRSQRGPGSVSGVAPPEDIHQVHNTGDTIAITLHVYGADLSQGTSVRRTYELRTD
jgi:predicted metal-dependent enzyme (double-stranded beta helix superfamily)